MTMKTRAGLYCCLVLTVLWLSYVALPCAARPLPDGIVQNVQQTVPEKQSPSLESDRRGEDPISVPQEHWIIMIVTTLIVILIVMIHYEVLRYLSALLTRLKVVPRFRIVVLIVGMLMAHVAEVWVFAFGYYALDGLHEFGYLVGIIDKGPLEYVYYSVVVYTSVGFGDIIPVGPIRFLTAMEALCGLVLVAWSASFTFLEMQRYWKDNGS